MQALVRKIDIVGIACSAGGINALQIVLGNLPKNFPVPIVVVQHIGPQHPSLLAEILSRSCSLSVKSAQNHEILLPGTVYLAPPNKHVLIDEQKRIVLSDKDAVHFLRPCADLLFESIAQTYGPLSVVLVLSGTGSDGTAGGRAVKESGGYVIAQDEQSSAFFGMPSSAIQSGVVDKVLPISEMAEYLVSLSEQNRER
jgi:two-component system chemotaxis response regulator CheB